MTFNVQYIKQTAEREKVMILGQEEVRKVLIRLNKVQKMSSRQIAKKFNITHHANIHNWLQGKTINVQMLEHLTKEINKSEKRKAKGKK